MSRDQQLNIQIVDGVLSISIGLDILQHSLDYGLADTFGPCRIDDPETFFLEFVDYLKSEEEDGTTAIHKMLDKVAATAFENGAEGLSNEDGH